MKVAKFGGSSLASAAQIQQVADIIKADPERRIIVVSAPGKRHPDDTKVTDLLIAAAEARFANKSGRAELDLVIARYADIGAGLDLPATDLDPIVADLEERLACDPRDEAGFIDTMKAGGEDNCARLVAQYLRAQGVEAHYVNPRDGGLTLSDEPGNGQLRALRQRPGVTVFPGFFGYSANGRVVTFSRGGSDITGSILAAAVDADLYENFTDVDSVFVANPTLVKNPVSVAEMTYREMRELAYAGFSVFHDEALEAVFHAGIPVAIKNTNNPQAPVRASPLSAKLKTYPWWALRPPAAFAVSTSANT
jgi:aspartate kinase